MRRSFFLFLTMLMCASVSLAESSTTIILKVGSGITRLPIIVDTSVGKIKVYDIVRYDRNISIYGCTDSEGNRIVVPLGNTNYKYKSSGSQTQSSLVKTYVFKTYYNNPDRRQSNSSRTYSNGLPSVDVWGMWKRSRTQYSQNQNNSYDDDDDDDEQVEIEMPKPKPIPQPKVYDYSGQCGENVRWEYDPMAHQVKLNVINGGGRDFYGYKGRVYITGEGEMQNFAKRELVPWVPFQYDIKDYFLSDGITNIGDNAFSYMNLDSLFIPESVRKIGNAAFSGSNIRELIIPKGVVEIGKEAFRNSCYLENVVLPVNLKVLPSKTFMDCSQLRNVLLPPELEEIGYGAFYGCDSLRSIVIPDSVKVIGSSCFNRCPKLESIQLSKNISRLPYGTFEQCKSLKEFVIPDKVTEIGSFCFAGCSNLENVVFPSGLLKIEESAFINTKLKSVSLPKKTKVNVKKTFPKDCIVTRIK